MSYSFIFNEQFSASLGLFRRLALSRFLIDLLAILQKSLDRAIFVYIPFLYARLDRVALELRLQLCTFETSTKSSEISFDPDSLSE